VVAVDGDVYLIEGFALWQMGEHLPSRVGPVAAWT
jgi:hypothetical protein